ncbi:MAG TPA: sigma factor-like helix-turn-helix DNA-binding protein [Candidatus Hydrogenedentes bacterium]|nr:sigma factor-like helix-turn-helix DNA-binding protein [Candidatus Hydrogenedentota bacterium]
MYRHKFNPTKRYIAFLSPDAFDETPAAHGLWHEAPEAVRAGLRWGRRKSELLRWVRQRMNDRLTAREQQCIELHYFHDKTFMAIAAITRTSASSSCRAVWRGIRKLRQAAVEEGLVRPPGS